MSIAQAIPAFISIGTSVLRAVKDAEAEVQGAGNGDFKKILVMEIIEECILSLGVDAALAERLKVFAGKLIDKLVTLYNTKGTFSK